MIYLDTSAVLKLIKAEAESVALGAHLRDRTDLVSSTLLIVEARRGTLRSAPQRMPRLDLFLTRVGTVDISDPVIESASRIHDPMLRSLDAIHLATALLIRDDLDELITYDTRLREAAEAHGIPTTAPA